MGSTSPIKTIINLTLGENLTAPSISYSSYSGRHTVIVSVGTTTVVVTSTTLAEAVESSTAKMTETVGTGAMVETAEVIAASPSGVSADFIFSLEPETTDIMPPPVVSAASIFSLEPETTDIMPPPVVSAASILSLEPETTDVVAPSVVSEASVISLESEITDIVAMSLQIRRALKCPICLTLMSFMSCFCPNGHAVCQSCMRTLLNTSTINTQCPLCRTSMVEPASISAILIKLAEFSRLVKVACSNRSYGCPDLVPVLNVTEHESECCYVPDVQCLAPMCQWVGVYEQLYEHVFNVHSGVAVESSMNLLNVTDLHTITRRRSRTYLLRLPYGMMWVLLSRGTRSRIQTGLFMVNNNRGGQHSTSDLNQTGGNPRHPEFLYQITWFDVNDRTRARVKSRTKQVYWSTALKEGCHTTVFPNTYATFRPRTGRMVINWFPRNGSNSQVRNHAP